MKKIALLSMLTLALLLTQCKKKEVDAVTNSAEKVFITFNATNVGEKTVFHPEDGTFTWNAGSTEYIHVGGNVTGYLGKLSKEAGSSDFSGDIDDPSSNERLYFIYLGNGDKDIDASAESTTMDFSNQSSTGTVSNVTNYHIAVGSAAYSASGEYSANMNMKMAIAYFDLSDFSGETVYLQGNYVYSKANINFKEGTVTGSDGIINLGTGGSSKFVALIPQATPSKTTVKFDSDQKTGSIEFNRGIKAGSYYCQDATTALAPTMGSLPDGVIPALFTVSTKKMVRFSKGNLVYNMSAETWSFLEHQYDGVETGEGDVLNSDYVGKSLVSLFGWGTSGYNLRGTENNYYYRPYNTNTDSGNNYGPEGSYPLSGRNSRGDWGYNAISNGGNAVNCGWRTLTIIEWDYLLKTRTTSSGKRYVKATVNGKKGLIVFPNNWSSTHSFTGANTTSTNYNVNVVDLSVWSELESGGAVFLPANGRRQGTSLTLVGSTGFYWSASQLGEPYARLLYFSNGALSTTKDGIGSDGMNVYNRFRGYSVRLVLDK